MHSCEPADVDVDAACYPPQRLRFGKPPQPMNSPTGRLFMESKRLLLKHCHIFAIVDQLLAHMADKFSKWAQGADIRFFAPCGLEFCFG